MARPLAENWYDKIGILNFAIEIDQSGNFKDEIIIRHVSSFAYSNFDHHNGPWRFYALFVVLRPKLITLGQTFSIKSGSRSIRHSDNILRA